MPSRAQEIELAYCRLIDKHLADLVAGKVEYMFEIQDFAQCLHIHHIHLSNLLKEATGLSPCGIYQPKILKVAKSLLDNPSLSIRDVAYILTFEPSQFTKWFRRIDGRMSPSGYRKFAAT